MHTSGIWLFSDYKYSLKCGHTHASQPWETRFPREKLKCGFECPWLILIKCSWQAGDRQVADDAAEKEGRLGTSSKSSHDRLSLVQQGAPESKTADLKSQAFIFLHLVSSIKGCLEAGYKLSGISTLPPMYV